MMVITNLMAAVSPIIVQMVRQPVQIAEQQVRNRPAAAVYGAARPTVRAIILAIAQGQTVVFA
jgi:hypothetical protein